MHTQRFAAIDIGTVTCRLLIADADDTGLHELYRACAITNLGEGVDATGVLTDAAMKRVDSQMDVFQHDIERFSAADTPVRVIAMATSASRDARNAADFVAMLARRGITLSVIPGDREAALSFLGASVDFPGKNLVVADIGGGSTELIAERCRGSRFSSIRSTSVAGASPSGFCRGSPTADQMDQARAWAHGQFEEFFDQVRARGFAIDRAVAVAGTATTVVSIDQQMVEYDSARVHGSVESLQTLRRMRARLASMTESQRRQVTGLQPGRAPVIVAGLLILKTCCSLPASIRSPPANRIFCRASSWMRPLHSRSYGERVTSAGCLRVSECFLL